MLKPGPQSVLQQAGDHDPNAAAIWRLIILGLWCIIAPTLHLCYIFYGRVRQWNKAQAN